jgi:O-antigen ligase
VPQKAQPVTQLRTFVAATPQRFPPLGIIERAIAVLVVAAVVVLPLAFVPSLDDGYALPKVMVLRVVALVCSALFLAYVLRNGSLTRNADPRIDVPLACLAALLIAASVASVDRVQSFVGEAYQYQGLTTVLVYVGSFYAARVSLGTAKGFRTILTATVGTGAVVSTYGIAQSLGIDPFWSGPPDERVISSVGQANDLAAYLDLVVIAAIGLWATARRVGRMGLVVAVVVTLVTLALTFSRGGYLGLAAALCVLVVPRFSAPRTLWVALLGLTLALVTLAVALVLPTTRLLAERVTDRLGAMIDLNEGSVHMHLDAWRVGVQIAIEHPVLGTGPETFPVVFRPYLDQVLPPDRAAVLGRFRLESPHNELIGIAAETGLPALGAYLAFLVACAMRCVKRARVSDVASKSTALVVLAVLVGHVVTNFFMTPEVATSEVFWITMGAGLAAMNAGRSDSPDRIGGLEPSAG